MHNLQWFPSWVFLEFSWVLRLMPGDLCTAHGFTSLSLFLSERHDWRDTRGKWPLARNPDMSGWLHHTSITLVFVTAHVPTSCNWIGVVVVKRAIETVWIPNSSLEKEIVAIYRNYILKCKYLYGYSSSSHENNYKISFS
jgi:hypothetical protein